MPNRILKESIKTSAQIDALTWFEEVVYYRLIVSADDYGCMDGRVILLRNELFPTKENVTKKAVEDAIAKLASVGLLCKYTVNGMPYLCFPTWEKHQRIRNMHRKYPEPPNDIACQSIDSQLTASCQSESESESESESKRDKRAAARETPPTLEEIEAYVRERNSPVDARKFFEYFDAGGWRDAAGKPVRSWKQKLLTWEKYDTGRHPAPPQGQAVSPQRSPEEAAAERDRMARMLAALEAKK